MNKNYDAVIVGGGIQGAGCAQALSAKGYSVLLLEQSTIGSGTSCRSSKLIHGGLRYIESGQFTLVKKSLNERALLQKIAPTLVKKRAFYIPIYKNQRLKTWQLTIGLSLYCLLGNLRRDARFKRVPRAQWPQLDNIKQQGLSAVFQYYDAQTDDLLLTRAVIRSAINLGCTVLEQHSFEQATQIQNGNIQITFSQASEHSRVETAKHTVNAKVLINAAGPWVEQVQKKIEFDPSGPEITLIQGSHIELDLALSDKIFYVESPDDQRPIFIMPWKNRTLVGTTEKLHCGKPSQHQPSQQEIDYLYRALQHYFPDYNGKLINSWSGLRVLPQAENTSSLKRPFSRRARDTIIYTKQSNAPRAISLYGGKLTAYRVTAEEVCALAMRQLGKPLKFLDTANITLN